MLEFESRIKRKDQTFPTSALGRQLPVTVSIAYGENVPFADVPKKKHKGLTLACHGSPYKTEMLSNWVVLNATSLNPSPSISPNA